MAEDTTLRDRQLFTNERNTVRILPAAHQALVARHRHQLPRHHSP